MSVKIEQPYPVFRDKIGLPLNGGFVYIGVAGLNPETNPIQCYFDEDFTMVAPQPLRTINGYISRNGSPSNIFIKKTSFSIVVKDKFKILQFSDLNATGVISGSGLDIYEINGGIASVLSIAEMLSIESPKDDQVVFVEEKNSSYRYSPSDTTPLSINGWVLQHGKIVNASSLNIENGGNITSVFDYCLNNNLFLNIDDEQYFTTDSYETGVFIGNGEIKYNYDFIANNNTENIAKKISSPYASTQNTRSGWYDNVQARSNFEQGAGYGLIVNDANARPQISGFRTKQQQKDYPSVDIAGLYTHVMSPKVNTLSNCTFTANTVTSSSITTGLDVKVGDFITTSFDTAIGKQWRSEVVSIDFSTNTIHVTWWLYEFGDGEGIPPDGLSCYTPYVNGIWGQNTNVFMRSDDRVTTLIGFELGVISEKTRANFTKIDGFFAVNLTSSTARAQSAFKTSGDWDIGLDAGNSLTAVYCNGNSTIGIDYTPKDSTSTAITMRNPTVQGNLIESLAGSDVLFKVDSTGVQSQLKMSYSIHSASISYNGLQPSLCIGANAGAAHTTTINTARMFSGHILEFKQLEAVNWTIIAGTSTFVLNASGSNDYLKIMYDGNFFIKLFMGKSN